MQHITHLFSIVSLGASNLVGCPSWQSDKVLYIVRRQHKACEEITLQLVCILRFGKLHAFIIIK